MINSKDYEVKPDEKYDDYGLFCKPDMDFLGDKDRILTEIEKTRVKVEDLKMLLRAMLEIADGTYEFGSLNSLL